MTRRNAGWEEHAAPWLGAGVAIALCLCGGSASAHGLDANRVNLVLRGPRVEIVATPPAQALAFADRDGDGLLTRAEVDASRPAIRDALRTAVRVTDPAGTAPAELLYDVSTPTDPDPAVGADHLRVTLHAEFAEAPEALVVSVDFALEHPVALNAWRAIPPPEAAGADGGAPPAGIVVLEPRVETALLTAAAPRVTLFGGPPAPTTPAPTTPAPATPDPTTASPTTTAPTPHAAPRDRPALPTPLALVAGCAAFALLIRQRRSLSDGVSDDR